MRPCKIGFIGTGGRSVRYAEHYVGRDDVEIVALADPNPHNRKAFRQMAGVPEAQEFDDWDRHFIRLSGRRTDRLGRVVDH